MQPDAVVPDAVVYEQLSRAIKERSHPASPLAALGDADRIGAAVAIHRNNVRAAYTRVLRDAFPVVRRLVGDAFFQAMSNEYFHAHPPGSPLVSRYGDNFPEFLETFAPAARLAYLPDIARLEILWLKAYHAAEARSASAQSIFNALAESADTARLVLHPSMQILLSPHPVYTIWNRNRQPGFEKLTLKSEPEFVLIRRPEHEVLTQAISPALHAALGALIRGGALGDSLNCALAVDADADPAALVYDIASMKIVVEVI